ncbi:hypothetical protein PG996_004729 [Apiospora saccharicola]|uniref:Uncharacterized protein n=1 Tax=Apiospora saccharicola TaxID=335842 RepID=A0ABR1W8P8_9PEZI
MSSTRSKPQSQSSTSTSNLVWYGHLPCVCSSTKGCSSHIESPFDGFYNPLLPPNAPAKLVYGGSQPRIMESGSSFDGTPISSQPSSRSQKLPESRSGNESPASSRSSQSTEQASFFHSVSSRLRKHREPRASTPQSLQAELQNRSARDRPPAYSAEVDQTITHLQPPQPDEVIEPRDADTQDRPPAYSAEPEQTNTNLQPPPFWSTSILQPGAGSGVSYYPGHCHAIDNSWSQMSVKINPMDPRVMPRTVLPFDEASFGTLAPLHPSMPYHLAFYHLHWARRAIEKRNALSGTCRLIECSGESLASPNQEHGPKYQWSSELYWTTKLVQKQELTYRIDAQGTNNNNNNSGIDITMCPHITVSLGKVKIENSGIMGRPRASARISYKSGRHSVHWDSKKGRLAKLHICPTCYCDLEQDLEVQGNEISVRFTVYRDLGDGIDRFDPKWRALLTGEGKEKTRQHARYIDGPQKYQVYWNVWQAAYFLKRPNLHLVTFKTGSGKEFNGLYRINITDPRLREEAKNVVTWTEGSRW